MTDHEVQLGAAAALREAILDRLEQVSVLVLLPVFFVVSGLRGRRLTGCQR